MELSPRQNKLVITLVASFAIFALVAVGSVSLFALSLNDRAPQPRVTSGTGGSLLSSGALTGTMQGRTPYSPTSQYVEPGADSDELTLAFKEDDSGKVIRPIDEDEIRETVNKRQNELITCYAEALDRNEDLRGRVDLHFRIAGDGRVAMVKVTQSGLRDPPTEDCLVNAARAWRFPKSGAEQLARFDTDFMFTY